MSIHWKRIGKRTVTAALVTVLSLEQAFLSLAGEQNTAALVQNHPDAMEETGENRHLEEASYPQEKRVEDEIPMGEDGGLGSKDELEIPSEKAKDAASDARRDIPSESVTRIPLEAQPDTPAERVTEHPLEGESDPPLAAQPENPREDQQGIPSEAQPDALGEKVAEIASEGAGNILLRDEPEIPFDKAPDIATGNKGDISSEEVLEIPSEGALAVRRSAAPWDAGRPASPSQAVRNVLGALEAEEYQVNFYVDGEIWDSQPVYPCTIYIRNVRNTSGGICGR